MWASAISHVFSRVVDVPKVAIGPNDLEIARQGQAYCVCVRMQTSLHLFILLFSRSGISLDDPCSAFPFLVVTC